MSYLKNRSQQHDTVSLHSLWLFLFSLTAQSNKLSDQAFNVFKHGCLARCLGHSAPVLVLGKPMCKPRLGREKLFLMSWSRDSLTLLKEQRIAHVWVENSVCSKMSPPWRWSFLQFYGVYMLHNIIHSLFFINK